MIEKVSLIRQTEIQKGLYLAYARVYYVNNFCVKALQ